MTIAMNLKCLTSLRRELRCLSALLFMVGGCAADADGIENDETVGKVESKWQSPYIVHTAIGPLSGTSDDAPSAVSCPSEYTLTGCDCYSPWGACDGAYASSALCYAFNDGGNGVYAVAQCMRTNGTIAYNQDMASAQSGSGDDNPTSVACPASLTLTGCTCYSPWDACDGAYPDVVGGLETCTAFNSGGYGAFARARCTNLGDTSRQHLMGPRSGTFNHAASSVSCLSGYSLTGCSCYSPWASCNGAVPSGTDTCTAYNQNNGNGVFAVAICVSINR